MKNIESLDSMNPNVHEVNLASQPVVHRNEALQFLCFGFQAVEPRRAWYPPLPVPQLQKDGARSHVKRNKVMEKEALVAMTTIKNQTRTQLTCVAGVFILALLPRQRMSCIVMIAVRATEERAH